VSGVWWIVSCCAKAIAGMASSNMMAKRFSKVYLLFAVVHFRL
jgi:hypothetical protein